MTDIERAIMFLGYSNNMVRHAHQLAKDQLDMIDDEVSRLHITHFLLGAWEASVSLNRALARLDKESHNV